MQSEAPKIVIDYTMTTPVILQRAHAYTLRYTIADKLEYCGRKAGMYSYAHHVKICQHPSKLLKSSGRLALGKQ